LICFSSICSLRVFAESILLISLQKLATQSKSQRAFALYHVIPPPFCSFFSMLGYQSKEGTNEGRREILN
jgi:hypothetical protein